MTEKSEIRKQMRLRRNMLDELDRQESAIDLFNNLRAFPSYLSAQNIACYLANDGEISLSPVIQDLWRRNRKCLLPVLFGYGKNKMHFARYQQNSLMKLNKYKIIEPDVPIKNQFWPRQLDVVLMPLVAYDPNGNRLGMGGGYYDRSFAFLRHRQVWKKPKLVGVAYDFQEVDALESESWDVPLDAIVTESKTIIF